MVRRLDSAAPAAAPPKAATAAEAPPEAAPPTAFPKNLDAFGATAGHRPLPPTSLGTIDGHAVSINAQGRLVLPGDTGTIKDTLAAQRAALKTDQPFVKVVNKLVLKDVADRLVALHRAGTFEATDDKQVLDQRQLRASSMALLERVAMRAGALGDRPLQTAMTTQLTTLIAAEPFRPLRDFTWESLNARADDKLMPVVSGAKEAIYPSKPPYDKMLADGVLRIAYYIDNEGSKILGQREFLRSLDLKETMIDPNTFSYVKEATGNRPRIEVTLRSPQVHSDSPALFEKIDDPGTDLIAYTGHAGYGQRVEAAISSGAKATGEGKLVVLMQCSGDSSIESLERAFPDAQVISTTQASNDPKDQAMFKQLLDGLMARADYASISRNVLQKLKGLDWDNGTKPEKHYYYPDSAKIVGPHVDRDRDGIGDGVGVDRKANPGDHLFNVTYPTRLDAAGGYDPVAQPIDADALDGTAANKAVGALSLVLRYNNLLPKAQAEKLKWGDSLVQAAGFFTPAADDNHAFRFTTDPASGKVKVETSTRFAHTKPTDLAPMMAYEAGQFLGKTAGLDAVGCTAMALAMTAQVVHQQEGSSWRVSRTAFDELWADESLLAQRYGLGKVGIQDVAEALGPAKDDELAVSNFEALKKWVASKPELAKVNERMPTRVGQPLTVPAGLRLGSEGLNLKSLQRIVDAVGVKGTVEAFGPVGFSSGEPNNLTVTYREPTGQLRMLGLSVDSDSLVRAASRVDLDVEGAKRRVGRAYLVQVAAALKHDPKPWLDAFTTLTAAGKTSAEAVSAVLEKERKNVPLGTDLPFPSRFETLRTYGLASAAESAPIFETLMNLYPRAGAEVGELLVLRWLDGASERRGTYQVPRDAGRDGRT